MTSLSVRYDGPRQAALQRTSGGGKMVDLAAVTAARERLGTVVRRTPLLRSLTWGAIARAPVYLKAENLQRTGSFKIRGASNMIALLTADEKCRGVIAASAGNHAQGVAVAATSAGIPSVVVMPESAPFAKVEATLNYGAEVIQTGAGYAEAATAMELIAAERGMTIVPAFDDERIIAGQGTIGLEIVQDLPEVELVIVPVGGGGLAAGVAVAIKGLLPAVSVIGVQAAASSAAARLFRHQEAPAIAAEPWRVTIADGIAVRTPGSITMPILLRLLDDLVVVDDEAISAAMVRLMEFSKLVVEGAGAVGTAALLRGAVRPEGRTTAVVLSGGNLDINLLTRIVEHGLSESGRYLTVRVAIDDRPGRLQHAVAVLASTGANVLDVQHRRSGSHLTFGKVEVEFLVETRNAHHANSVFEALRSAGYTDEVGGANRGRRFVRHD